MMDILKDMSDEEVLALANTETPQPLPGTWELMAPDGRIWTGDSPIKCLHAEINARVPPQVALARIKRGLMEEAAVVSRERCIEIVMRELDSNGQAQAIALAIRDA